MIFKNKFLILMGALLIMSVGCEDEDRAPIVVLDSVEKGAYPRLVTQTNALINLFDIAGSSYTYQVEFVDIEGGDLVAEYVLDMVYDDNNPDNGDNSTGPVEFLKFSASDFSMGSNGYLAAPSVTITGPEALSAAGVNAEDVLAGDNFNFQGRVILTDGRVFTQNNSSTTVTGPAFLGHFNFTLPANCPSDLTGTYSYVTTDAWCDGSTVEGEVEIVAQGGGVYNFSDWSFGAYGPCYGAIANQPGITFSEVCAVVEFTAVVDSYGDTWTFDSSIDGENWIINWTNTYGEAGNSTVTFPGGVPFTLK